MSEKELNEMMVSEETDYVTAEKEIDDLKAEIGRMLKKLNELLPEEKEIIKKIRKVLEEHKLRYAYDEDEPKRIGLGFSMENKPFIIHIILQNGKVILKLCFPFRVQANAYPIMCMFMAEFNKDKAFSLLNIDPDNGELTMEYSYLLEEPEHFDKKYFWIYMTSLIQTAQEIYSKAARLSVGMVSGKDRKLYKKLLEIALETVNGDFDDDNTNNGIASLKSDSLPDSSDRFGKNDGDKSKEDDSDADDEDITSDIMHDLRRRTGLPSFEEFMRMKTQAEDSEEETGEQPEKASGMLSMFARREEDMDPGVVGENEDE